ncbi:HMCN1 [Branchiostoma lanceolatum]|uniref:HMCN1 protein n=1 Tax=Branchiostoma lanceolatum TaxID=7740 RepID=A0A8K0E8R7_BRALA|nr:HMCN1 [Branchiostoma lanceolatum]
MLVLLATSIASLCLLTDGAVYDWTYTKPGPEATDARLDGHAVRRFDYAHSVLACARACLQLQTCSSYNYNKAVTTCELNAVVTNSSVPLVSAAGYQYFGRTDIIPAEEGLPACASRPCLHGGMCQERPGSIPPYYCFCAATDYHGQQCQDQVLDGGWGEWGSWGSCSESCGLGLRVRQRSCDNPTATPGRGRGCAGLAEQKGQCNKTRCPFWSEWSPVGNCSSHRVCGPGSQNYIRVCERGGTVDVDPGCTGPANTTFPCQSRPCRTAVRLRDGPSVGEGRLEVYDAQEREWGTVCNLGWSAVNSDVVCRQMGFTGTAAGKDGNARPPIACSTTTEDFTETEFTVRCPTGCAGDSSEVWGTVIYTGDSSICRAAIHDQRISNEVGGDVTVHVLAGRSEYTGSTRSGVQSRSYDSYGPAMYMSGYTVMTSADDDVPIVLSGVTCAGVETSLVSCPHQGWRETANCDHSMDVIVHCQVDGAWGAWGSWGPCSTEPCGGAGTRERQRVCNRPPPANRGLPCGGDAVQSRPCYRDPC